MYFVVKPPRRICRAERADEKLGIWYNVAMNTKSCALKFAGSVFAMMLSFEANAWMDQWAPEFKATAANVEALPKVSVSNYVCTATEGGEFRWEYSEGYAIDLNDDGTKDQVFIIPWMGNGLSALGYYVHFMVSDGAKGRKKTVIEGYGVSKSDFVKVKGKTYFRHSEFFEHFEKSEHNHWVYQLFSFDKNGVMKCSNADFGEKFPAVTIYYIKPKFRQIELTAGDLKKIAAETKPVAK